MMACVAVHGCEVDVFPWICFTRRQKEAQNMGPHPLQKEAAVFPEGWDEKVHATLATAWGQQRGQGGTQRPPGESTADSKPD